MIKKFTLLLLAMLCIAGTNAKNKVTTLWEDTYSSAIELNSATVATFVEGDVLRISLTLTQASNFGISYKSAGNGWTDTAIPSVGTMWPWVSTTGDTNYDVTFTTADITALSGQNIYIQKGTNSTITKIELIHPLTPASTSNISTDSYTADWTGKQYTGVSEAKVGDVIQFTFTATSTWVQIYVMNYAKGEDFATAAYSVNKDETYTYEYVIPDYATLKEIREKGFSIKGADFIISSVDLLTYSDSYGYITINIPEVGYATWSSDKKYDFKSAGLQAYYASAVATGSVTLTPMDITWDWQGYIIKGSEGEYDVLESLTEDGDSYYPSTNYLKCNIYESDVYDSGKNRYIFAMKKNGDASSVGFYKLAGSHTLAANKAYLETDSDLTPSSSDPGPSTPAPALNLIFGGEGEGTTAINTVSKNPVVEDGIYYSLQGVAVKNPSKGLYILNGKKVIVK